MKKIAFYFTGFAFATLLFSCASSNINRFENNDLEVASTHSIPAVKNENIVSLNNTAIKTIENNIEEVNLAANTQPQTIIKNNAPVKKNATVVLKSQEVQTASNVKSLNKSELKSNYQAKKMTLTERIKTRFLEKINRMMGGGGKSQLVALLLAIFLGGLGIHRFYLGYIGIGVVQLLTGGLCIWALVDLIRIAMGSLKPKDGEYSETLGGK